MYDQVLIKPDSCVTMDDPNAHFPLPQWNFNNGRPDVAVFKLLIRKVLLWSLYLQMLHRPSFIPSEAPRYSMLDCHLYKHKPLCVHTRWPEGILVINLQGWHLVSWDKISYFTRTALIWLEWLADKPWGPTCCSPLLPAPGWHYRFVMWALVVVLLSHLSPHSSLSHALCFDMNLRLLTARDISIEGNDFVH